LTVARPVVFLTDYWLADEYVGICHAVVARLAPDVRVIDLSHGVARGDVLEGAVTLASAAPYAPEDAVYLAVVDPGVGTDRRAVAMEAGSASLVGRDNGLLSMAADALGGVARAVEIDPGRVAPDPVSATFHGRDMFAPAAAILARGGSLDDVGGEVETTSLVRINIPEPNARPGRLEATVIGIDRFGNIRLGARLSDLERAGTSGENRNIGLEMPLRREGTSGAIAGYEVPLRPVRTFAELDPAEVGILEDSGGWLALVRNGSSAAEALRLAPYDRVVLSAAGGAVG
jgi:S-adenosyl-L-methionine hydrolase (adenosine-forming)